MASPAAPPSALRQRISLPVLVARRQMHRKIPGFHFSSEPSEDGSEAPRRSRSLFSKLTKSSSRDSGSGRRSPSPYAGRSETGGRRRAGDSRASSPERSGAYSDADGDSDSDGGALSSSERVGPGSSRRYSSGTAFSGGVGADSSAGEETQSEFDYSEQSGGEDDSSDSFDEELDEELIANTEANAGSQTAAEILLAQPATTVEEGLEDGPNLVKSPASPFALSSSTTSARRPATAASTGAAPASSVSTAYRTPRRRKSTIKQDFQLVASRPSYERNRCSITLTHGDPEGHMASLREAGTDRRRSKTYVVASDLSEESYYAIEWAIGTVVRNGDELLFVTVMETDSKLDPEDGGSSTEKTNKIRNQQERQTRVLQLSREATALLERTRLHVRVQCQAIHAKNARHMLIDLIDYFQPTLVLVGSRGLGKLKGTILGSMSHYLIQKSSAPVMVTRRRLKPVRRPRKPISDLQRAPRVGGLANATIDTESHTGMLPPTGSAAEAALLKKQQDAAAGKGDDGETDTEGRASFRP